MSNPQDLSTPKTAMRTDGDKDYSFCLFAVRVNGDGSVGQRKLASIHPYYLIQGFKIEGDTVYVEKSVLSTMRWDMYGSTFNNNLLYKPAVNITAIVGENGSGKSTLVEYIIRLLNNVSASAFGEIKTSDSSDRLHYIDGVDGELFYMQYGQVYSVVVKNDSARIKAYRCDCEKCTDKSVTFTPKGYVYDNHGTGQEKNHTLFSRSSSTDVFKSLFYTIVSNHSIYAYNTNDYSDEVDDDKTEQEAEVLYRRSFAERSNQIGVVKSQYPIDQRCWLHGLFHKNDGYQVPLVLTPYRSEGAIDINNENLLANERLVALIVDEKSNFRTINDHLKVESLTLKRSDEVYDYERFKKKLKLTKLSIEVYHELKNKTKKIWWEKTGLLSEMGKNKKFYQDAIGYLTYKTIKVSKQYQQYRFFYKHFKNNDCQFNEEELDALIGKMLLDSSHITAKIYQTLAYLAYEIYTDDVISKPIIPGEIKVNEYAKYEDGRVVIGLVLMNMQTAKLIPAPIFDVTINLRDSYTKDLVPFETISSGEKQLTYAVSSILYHLINIESVSLDNNRYRILYDHVNIILEEIELYFHPNLQKRFIKFLLDSLNTITFDNLKGLNIILVTHSPFVLSDIPSSNILALDKKGTQSESVKSFCANIHEMLADSFFLQDGYIGDFAQWYINGIIKDLDSSEDDIDSKELHRKIVVIDEPVVRMTLLEQYHHKYPKSSKALRKAELMKELDVIRKMIDDVEA